MSNDKLNGRIVYLPRGRDLLADAIAASNADLFEQDEGVIWIAAGKLLAVNPETLRQIIRLYVVTKHPRETADGYEVEYRAYEPNEMTLRTLLMAKSREDGGLMQRLPKGPRTLSKHQQQEIGDRLRRGEPAARIAYAFGTDVATIQRVTR